MRDSQFIQDFANQAAQVLFGGNLDGMVTTNDLFDGKFLILRKGHNKYLHQMVLS